MQITIEHKIHYLKNEIKKNPLLLIDLELLKIANKHGQTVPFKLNSVQQKLHNFIKKYYGKRPLRIIILKARKQGISTYVESLLYAITSQKENINSLVIAHRADAANYIFDMSKFYHDNLEIDHSYLANELEKNNAKMLEFKGKNSKLMVKVEDEVRGFDFLNAHCSEIAFYKNASKVFTALNNAIPKTNNSLLLLESTANGVGDYFYNTWNNALTVEEWERQDDIAYVKFFFPWYESEDNTLDMRADEEISYPNQYASDLIAIKKRHKLSDGQMKWYINTLKNECSGNIDTMRQEHPTTDIEAFIASGSPVFNVDYLTDMYNREVENRKNGLWHKYSIIDNGNFNYSLVESLHGSDIEIYQKPIYDQQYLITCDLAQGLEIDGEDTKSDYSVANVWNILTGEQCLNYRFSGEIHLFTDECYRIARIYNNAYIYPERNSIGLAFIEIIKDKYKYSRMITFDGDDKPGFPTLVNTKQPAIVCAQTLISKGYFNFHSIDTIKELISFVKFRGKMQASSGNHDDEVTTVWIASHAVDHGLIQKALNEKAIAQMKQNNLPREFREIQNRLMEKRTGQKRKNRITGY